MKSLLLALVLFVSWSSVSQAHPYHHGGGYYRGGGHYGGYYRYAPPIFYPAPVYVAPIAPIYIAPPPPPAIWYCTAFNSAGQGVVGSGYSAQQASWDAFNACGGNLNDCYAPVDTCHL